MPTLNLRLRRDWPRLAALAFCCIATAAQSQSDAAIQPPAPKVGDIWDYRTIDLWNGKELSTASFDLVEIQSERFVTRVKASNSSDVRTNISTRTWAPCRMLTNSDKEVCAGPLKFPLQVGDRTTIEGLPWSNGQGKFDEKCEVKARESLTVPAGTFDTVRVECEGFQTRLFGGSFAGRIKEVFWYAPAVHRYVRGQFFSFQSNGQADTKIQNDLVKYTSR